MIEKIHSHPLDKDYRPYEITVDGTTSLCRLFYPEEDSIKNRYTESLLEHTIKELQSLGFFVKKIWHTSDIPDGFNGPIPCFIFETVKLPKPERVFPKELLEKTK